MKIQGFLARSPLFAIYVAQDQILGRFQVELRKENLHFIQALALTGLFFEDASVRPSQLATILGASRSNISHALRGLERQRLIERAHFSPDARVYLFNLTKEGRRKAQRLIKIFDEYETQIEKSFDRIDLSSFQEEKNSVRLNAYLRILSQSAGETHNN